MTKLSKSSPLQPVDYTKREVLAIQALHTGTANEDQQKMALDFVIRKVCKTDDEHYHPGPDGPRETDIALGKAHVGRQLIKFTKLSVGNMK